MERVELMELYKLFREETHRSIDLHAQHFGRFLTLITAILGITIAAISYFGEVPESQGMIAIVGGLFGVGIAMIGKKMCDRFYEGMLEGISVTAKIESLLDIEKVLSIDEEHEGPFMKDKYLLPERWIKSRGRYDRSVDFISQSLTRGSNRFVHYTFYSLIFVSLLVVVYGIVLLPGL